MKKIGSVIIIGLLCFSAISMLSIQVKAHSGVALSAWSLFTPTIDGVISSGEWDDASQVTFNLTYSVPEDPSQSTFPLITESHESALYVKNDEIYLYLTILIKNEDYSDYDEVDIFFDNNHNGMLETGDDVLSSFYEDAFSGEGYFGPDKLWQGKNDLLFAKSHTATELNAIGDWSFEFRHPLNSDDDSHDFSLEIGDVVGFSILFIDFVPTPEFPTAGWSSTFPDQGNLPLDASMYADIIIHAAIGNWTVLELLPATESNKAGKTIPVKFSLRVAVSVDPARPFVRDEELTIIIYEKTRPANVLQISTYGTTTKDYRIDETDELYITNFQTLRTPTTYVVQVYQKDMLIGAFEFQTLK